MPAGSGVAEKQPTHGQNEWVKEMRCRLIHTIVHQSAGPTIDVILKAAQEDKRWPEAHWGGARKGPPDYQQVRNYLKRLERDGRVTCLRSNNYTVTFVSNTAPLPLARPMRKRAAEALRLKSEGKNGVQIAEELGISRSLAYGLINDPYGDHEVERKKGYCPACGGKKDPAVEWCRKCKTAKVEDLLPTPDFLAIARNYEQATGCPVVFGVTEDYERLIRVGTDRGIWEYKLNRHQSWDDAVEDMGLV